MAFLEDGSSARRDRASLCETEDLSVSTGAALAGVYSPGITVGVATSAGG